MNNIIEFPKHHNRRPKKQVDDSAFLQELVREHQNLREEVLLLSKTLNVLVRLLKERLK